MSGAQVIGLVAVVMALSIPILGILAGIMKSQHRAKFSNITDAERVRLNELNKIAETLSQRVSTLESILDSEMPDWREDHDQR